MKMVTPSLQFVLYLSVMDDQTLTIFIILMIQLIVSILMMIFYCRRIYKLSILASNLVEKRPFSMLFKIFLLASYMLFSIVDIILAYSVPNYWIYSAPWLTFVNIAPVLNMAMQIYIITREYKKKSPPILWHGIYWSFLIVIDSLTIWFIFKYDETGKFDIIVPILNIVFLSAILAYSLLIEKLRFVNSKNQIKEVPLINWDSFQNQPSNDKIYFEFNKEIQLQVVKGGVIYTFEVAVYIGNYSHIVKKTNLDFENLESDMKKLYPAANQVRIHQKGSNQTKNWLKRGEEKGEIYENYLLRLSQSFYFYTEVLLDFLEIDEKFKEPLRKLNKRRYSIVSEQVLDSFQNIQTKKFFTVRYSNNKISIDNPQILSLNIERDIKQIQSLHKRLLISNKLRNEILINKTQEEILQFIDTIANSKLYWNEFSAWMDISQSMRVHINNLFDMWYQGFATTKVDVLGHEISMDGTGKTPTFYLFNMTKSKGSGITKRQLKKRFKEFVMLEKQISKHYKNRPNVSVPRLPPKVSPFGSKTSAKARQIYLQTYLIELLALPEINHCIKLLEFLVAEETEVQTLFRSITNSNHSKVTLDQIKSLQEQTPNLEDLCVSKII